MTGDEELLRRSDTPYGWLLPLLIVAALAAAGTAGWLLA